MFSPSCDTSAAFLRQQGIIGATQTVAGLIGNLMADAVVEIAQGDFELLGSRVFFADIRRPQSVIARVSYSPKCSLNHKAVEAPQTTLQTQASDSVKALLDELAQYVDRPRIELRQPFIHGDQCIVCHELIAISQPEWMLSVHPHCENCGKGGYPRGNAEDIGADRQIGQDHDDCLLEVSATIIGIAAGEIIDSAGETHEFALPVGPSPFLSL